MPDYSSYQKKLIERYYDRRDEIMLDRLGEIVSELYLAESEKKATQLWKRAEKAMTALKIPPPLIEHIVSQGKAETLASNLKDWQETAKRQGSKKA